MGQSLKHRFGILVGQRDIDQLQLGIIDRQLGLCQSLILLTEKVSTNYHIGQIVQENMQMKTQQLLQWVKIRFQTQHIANKFDLVMENEQLRQVPKLEIMKFVQDNELLYIGESSALADINIKEVVETLMESNKFNIKLTFISDIHEVQQKVQEKKVQNSMKLKEKYSRTDSSLPNQSNNPCC
ncbi:UNKNOWN [Stylonychia lemnae]|uniref:Uncharacterized protein n=1 Tax=Stylonychia lemnae TaxID=5949 RepID=A0A077ZTM3_STYLE|nr:UNKNOWN [Stylonychia lemnae]|eukprot:CDW72685.1 UNKNOWN [Stylonychia lemnae]